jgi:hypothetical protein
MKKYRAGNWLRGFFEGEFSSIEEAWSYLSTRFLLSFPTDTPDGSRVILLEIYEVNSYNMEQFVLCKGDYTERNDLPKEEVLEKCKSSFHKGI